MPRNTVASFFPDTVYVRHCSTCLSNLILNQLSPSDTLFNDEFSVRD